MANLIIIFRLTVLATKISPTCCFQLQTSNSIRYRYFLNFQKGKVRDGPICIKRKINKIPLFSTKPNVQVNSTKNNIAPRQCTYFILTPETNLGELITGSRLILVV